MNRKIAICGAGIAGVSTAYFLAKEIKDVDIILIDKHQALNFTSSKSGENFRDYWPHQCMEALSSRSIELMKSLKNDLGDDAFDIVFSGYHFVSHLTNPIFADDDTIEFQKRNVVEYDTKGIQQKHPYLDTGISKSIFINNAGHVDSISMAGAMLSKAQEYGLQFKQTEIVNLELKNKRVNIQCSDKTNIEVDQIVIATGPFMNDTASMLGLSFPIWNTLQRKFIIPDPKGIIPRDMPFTIYADGQTLPWSLDELDLFKSNEDMHWMTKSFPGAIHIKPESGDRIKMGWAFSTDKVEPQWQVSNSEYFPQIVLTGASRFIPALREYADNIPTPIIEYAGHYIRTAENWPLIGPTELDNVFVVGALAGFGTMTACAAGELCAKHIDKKSLPDYARYFVPSRYNDPVVQQVISVSDLDGQL